MSRARKLRALINKYQAMMLQLEELANDLYDDNLPAPSDARLKTAELEAIRTIDMLLDNCLTNLHEELKIEEEES